MARGKIIVMRLRFGIEGLLKVIFIALPVRWTLVADTLPEAAEPLVAMLVERWNGKPVKVSAGVVSLRGSIFMEVED